MTDTSRMSYNSLKVRTPKGWKKYDPPRPSREIVTPDGIVVGYICERNHRYAEREYVRAVGDDHEIQSILDGWYEHQLEIEYAKIKEKWEKRGLKAKKRAEKKYKEKITKARAALGLKPATTK